MRISTKLQGTVVSVTKNKLGSELVADAAIGALALIVESVDDWEDPEMGVELLLQLENDDGATEIVAIESIEPISDTISLKTALTLAWVAGDKVRVYPVATVMEADVQIDGMDEEPMPCDVPTNLQDVLTAGIRDVGEGESVLVEYDGEDFTVVEVLGEDLERESLKAFPVEFWLDGDIVAMTGKARWYAMTDVEIQAVRLSSSEAVGGALRADVHKNGLTVFSDQGTRPTVTTGNHSSGEVTPQIVRVPRGQYLTVDIDDAPADLEAKITVQFWMVSGGPASSILTGLERIQLNDLLDVDVSAVADGDTIIFDETTGLFLPGTFSPGVGAHNLFSNVHPDVDDTDVPAADDVLTFDAVAGKWKAAPPTGGGGGTPGALIEYFKIVAAGLTAIVWTNMPAAETWFPWATFPGVMPPVMDLTGFTQARIMCYRGGNVGPVNGKLVVKAAQCVVDVNGAYPWPSTPDYVYLDGAAGPSVNINRWNTYLISGWVDLSAAVKAMDKASLGVFGKDGDGAADPNFIAVWIEFR